MRKLLCCVLSVLTVFSVASCGRNKKDENESAREDVTIIKVINFNGGVGQKWLENAKTRFTESVKDISYEEGKKGVYISIDGSTALNVASMNTSGYNIFFNEQSSELSGVIQKGYVLDINDLVTEKDDNGNSIENLIYEQQRSNFKGGDGNYYALPHYEWYPGLTYDKDLFDSKKLYIAKEDVANNKVVNYKGVRFVLDLADKSCGKDGVYGTADDGLPTTMREFIALCSKMNNSDIEPVTISGGNKRYSDYLLFSLWASLAGKDEANAIYNFDSETEVVTGFSNEPLYPGMGIDYIKKPITEKVKVTEATGWQAHETVSKYYATSLFEILYKEKWLSSDASEGTLSHTDAQSNFIMGSRLGGKDKGMIIEGSYWYNESVDAGNFSSFSEFFPGESRNLKFMPLPCSLDVPVTEGNGKKNVLMDEGNAAAFINAKIKNNNGLVRACKDFLKFLYSKEEIAEFILETGTFKALNFKLSDEQINKIENDFQKEVLKMRSNSDIIYASADNETYKQSGGAFNVSINNALYNPLLDGVMYDNLLDAIMTDKYNAQDLFKALSIKNGWDNYYKG